MKRDITFCDCCGTQTTEHYSDGDSLEAGLHIVIDDGRIFLRNTKKTSCGSSGQAAQLSGRDFCGEACLAKKLNEFLTKAGAALEVVPKL